MQFAYNHSGEENLPIIPLNFRHHVVSSFYHAYFVSICQCRTMHDTKFFCFLSSLCIPSISNITVLKIVFGLGQREGQSMCPIVSSIIYRILRSL